MFECPIPEVEKGRIVAGPFGSTAEYGNNGHFLLTAPNGVRLFARASDGMGWEHVSVSVYGGKRTPTWDEMCWIKDLFWPKDQVVIQYHPAESDYVNDHPYVLHLWRPIGKEIITPPPIMVGMKRKHKHH